MRVQRVAVYRVSLPFQMPVSHALSQGTFSQNIVVKIEAGEGGLKGYGEGTPRKYVTGDSQEEAVKTVVAMLRMESFPWDVKEVSDIRDFIGQLPDKKDYNPAVCALETALLDLLGKDQRVNVIRLFRPDFSPGPVIYGAAFPLEGPERLRALCLRIKKMRIKRIKLKMGVHLEQNRQALEVVHRVFGDDYDLKVDANGVWNAALTLEHLPLFLRYRVKVVEQPLSPDDPGLAEVAEAFKEKGIRLMADESACSGRDIEKLIADGLYDMVNIRLSKMGGFHRSLKAMERLRRAGCFFQVGCHMGESGILSAAGRVLALLAPDALYYDGSYDALLLQRNVTSKPVSFGLGGRAWPLSGPGLGVGVDEKSLRELSATPVEVSAPSGKVR